LRLFWRCIIGGISYIIGDISYIIGGISCIIGDISYIIGGISCIIGDISCIIAGISYMSLLLTPNMTAECPRTVCNILGDIKKNIIP
jgi:biotin transporter BioY